MNRSETIDELAKALAKAQAALKPAEKNSVNPHFKSQYADLNAVWDAIRKPFTENGLSFVQTTSTSEDKSLLSIETTMLHTTGQFISSVLEMPITQRTPQGIGSLISYGRRYGLSSMAGVVSDVDDDANGAMPANGNGRAQTNSKAQTNGKAQTKPKDTPTPAEPKWSEDDLAEIATLRDSIVKDYDLVAVDPAKTLAKFDSLATIAEKRDAAGKVALHVDSSLKQAIAEALKAQDWRPQDEIKFINKILADAVDVEGDVESLDDCSRDQLLAIFTDMHNSRMII